jgi:hypothetical protein
LPQTTDTVVSAIILQHDAILFPSFKDPACKQFA